MCNSSLKPWRRWGKNAKAASGLSLAIKLEAVTEVCGFAAVFTHQLFGALPAAAAIGCYAQLFTHLSVIRACLDDILDLLLSDGFAKTNVHGKPK
jgi:hypothetical protein